MCNSYADSVLNALPGRRQEFTGMGNPVVHISYGAALFDSCSFTDIGARSDDIDDTYGPARVGAIDVHGANATAALRNCTLADIAAESPVTTRSVASVFSDDPDLIVRLSSRGEFAPATVARCVCTGSSSVGAPTPRADVNISLAIDFLCPRAWTNIRLEQLS